MPAEPDRRVLVVSGPNLDRLGTRQPEVYGNGTLADLERMLVEFGGRIGLEVSCVQSNHEGDLIDAVHAADVDGIVINPGALTHTSHALADAIRAIGIPTIEVHLSNMHEREPWRSTSVISDACVATYYGRGAGGYRAAFRHLVNRWAAPFETVSYGPHPDNVGDLRAGGESLVVFIHGGVWRHQFERDTIESLAVDLHLRGHTTWNIEYRRLGKGGGWPACGHDVLTALDFIPQLGRQFRTTTVVGHSAGGYLGLWAAPRSRSPIDLIAALAPIVDLDHGASNPGELITESQLFLDSGAPAQADPGPVRTILAHGPGDAVVPFAHSAGLVERRGFELLESGDHHYDLLDPSKPHWQWVLERLPST